MSGTGSIPGPVSADRQAARFALRYALLLALLYSLGRLSRSREIIAMIQTGRGLMRLMAPLLVIGSFATAACAILNYHWAPSAEAFKQAMLEMGSRYKSLLTGA